MNIYRVIGDRVGTLEARGLAQQLVEWHDGMVKHLRVLGHRRAECAEGCPHDEARGLWAAAMDVFGPHAGDLSFLKTHGSRRHSRHQAAAAALYA